jgi:hypothetical protein
MDRMNGSVDDGLKLMDRKLGSVDDGLKLQPLFLYIR